MQSAPFFHFVWSHLVFLAISRAPFMFIRFSSTSKIWSHSSIQPSTRPGEKITLAGQVHLGGAMPQTGPAAFGIFTSASLFSSPVRVVGQCFSSHLFHKPHCKGFSSLFSPKSPFQKLGMRGMVAALSFLSRRTLKTTCSVCWFLDVFGWTNFFRFWTEPFLGFWNPQALPSSCPQNRCNKRSKTAIRRSNACPCWAFKFSLACPTRKTTVFFWGKKRKNNIFPILQVKKAKTQKNQNLSRNEDWHPWSP